jgi:uncharacterized protein YdeI (YjbR/CyaY-like superfamily)
MEPIYFESPEQFRDWLDANHAIATEVFVGFFRRATGRPSMTWSQSVDEALCYGWIDGRRHPIDAERTSLRFTPRKAGSTWSRVNIAKVAELTRHGRMRPAGVAAFAARTEAKSGIYSYESEAKEFPEELRERFQEHPQAWAFFNAQPPGYRKQMTHRVVSPKRADTRERRFNLLLEASAAGRRLL